MFKVVDTNNGNTATTAQRPLDMSVNSSKFFSSACPALTVNPGRLSGEDDPMQVSGQLPLSERASGSSIPVLIPTADSKRDKDASMCFQTDIAKSRKTIKKAEIKSSMEDPQRCVICCAQEADAVILPCCHGGLCFECGKRLGSQNAVCHFCRKVRSPHDPGRISGRCCVSVLTRTSLWTFSR